MRPEDLVALLRARPFVPLRIHMADGSQHEIHHPDLVMVARSRAHIGIAQNPPAGILKRVEYCWLEHIVRVEKLYSGDAPGWTPSV